MELHHTHGAALSAESPNKSSMNELPVVCKCAQAQCVCNAHIQVSSAMQCTDPLFCLGSTTVRTLPWIWTSRGLECSSLVLRGGNLRHKARIPISQMGRGDDRMYGNCIVSCLQNRHKLANFLHFIENASLPPHGWIEIFSEALRDLKAHHHRLRLPPPPSVQCRTNLLRHSQNARFHSSSNRTPDKSRSLIALTSIPGSGTNYNRRCLFYCTQMHTQ